MSAKELKKWGKTHKTELNIIKEIYELRKNTDLFGDNLEELIQKMRKCGELIEQLEQCDPKFYDAFLTKLEKNK